MSEPLRVEHRACNLCEAICGLEFKIEGEKIISIRGDDADPFSRGHICPKAVALKDIGTVGFWSVMIFLGILVVGFIYEWKKRRSGLALSK